MTGVGINDGDLLVVDRSLRPASGDVIIACVDGDFTVKTLRLGNGERGNALLGEKGSKFYSRIFVGCYLFIRTRIILNNPFINCPRCYSLSHIIQFTRYSRYR